MSAAAAESPNMEVKGVSKEMALLSNILAAYTFIAGESSNSCVYVCSSSSLSPHPAFVPDQPERTALVFLGGVCVGLLVTLSAIVFQIHCRADCHYGNSNKPQLHPKKRHRQHRRQHRRGCPFHQAAGSAPDDGAAARAGASGPAGDSDAEDWDDMSDLSARRRRRFERALLNATMFTSAEGTSRMSHPNIKRLLSYGSFAFYSRECQVLRPDINSSPKRTQIHLKKLIHHIYQALFTFQFKL